MVAIILLSLLGTDLLAALIGPVFDDLGDGPEEPFVNPGDPIDVSEGKTVFAGSGNDEITSDGSVGNATVFGGDGNDHIDADLQSGQMSGGAGDDILIADHSSYTLSVFGGAGNDSIDSSGSAIRARVYGGSGDDAMNLDYTNLGGDEQAIVDGGFGADTFNLGIDLDVDSSFDSPAPILTGGEGADMFALDVALGTVSIDDPATDGTSAGLVTITDFVPGSDQLHLDVGGAAVDLVETPNGDFTDVVLTYAAAGGQSVSAGGHPSGRGIRDHDGRHHCARGCGPGQLAWSSDPADLTAPHKTRLPCARAAQKAAPVCKSKGVAK